MESGQEDSMKDKGCRVRAAAEPGATRNGTSCRKDRHGYARRVPQTPHASLQKTQSAAVKDAGPESVRLVTGNSHLALLIAGTFTPTHTHAFTHPNTEGKRASEQENGEKRPRPPISTSLPAIRQQRGARMSIATCPQVVDTCSTQHQYCYTQCSSTLLLWKS